MKNKQISGLMVLISLLAYIAQAAALTQGTATPFRAGAAIGYTQGDSNIVYRGAIAAISTSTGKIVPATDTTASMMVVGCIAETSDNGGVNTALFSSSRKVVANRGVFRWENGNTFTVADVGQMCYIQDDHTVQKAATATYDIPVGVIVAVDSDGVWVDTTSLAKVLAGSLTTLTVSGNTALTGNQTVGGTFIGSSTVAATGFKIGAVSGWSGVATNVSTQATNVFFYSGGVVTNVTRNP